MLGAGNCQGFQLIDMSLRKYNQWKINKTVLDSEFEIVDSGNQVLDSWFLLVEFESNRQWDLNSLSCISDSKAWDSGFRKENFPRSGFHREKFSAFRNPDS